MRFTGRDTDICLETEHPEFSDWKWVPLSDVPGLAVPLSGTFTTVCVRCLRLIYPSRFVPLPQKMRECLACLEELHQPVQIVAFFCITSVFQSAAPEFLQHIAGLGTLRCIGDFVVTKKAAPRPSANASPNAPGREGENPKTLTEVLFKGL